MTSSPDTTISDGTAPYPGWTHKGHAVDLAKKRKSKRGRRKLPHTPMISITSLTDAVTLLLVYLLKTFATNPIEIKDSSLDVPRSVCRPDPAAAAKERELNIAPRDGCGEASMATIVMITGPKQKRTNGAPVDAIPRIAVNSDAILELDPKTYRIRDADKDPNSGGFVVMALRDALKKAKETEEMTAQIMGKKFDGKVIILADKNTPYRVLTDVLVTCGESGFADFRFAVIRPD